MLEAGLVAAGKAVGGKVAREGGKYIMGQAGVNSGIGSLNAYVNQERDIPISEDVSNIILKNTIRYIFYENFINGKTPNEAQLDTMLKLIAITSAKGNIHFALINITGSDDSTKLNQFYNIDYSFLNNDQKIKIINMLMNSDPGISRSRVVRTGEPTGAVAAASTATTPKKMVKISGSEGGGKSKRKRETKKRKKKKRKTKMR